MRPLNTTRRNGSPRWGAATMAESKQLGISPYEAALWHIVFRHDELIEYHRPRASTVPDPIQRFAFAVTRQALEDLRAPARTGIHYRPGADYWPDTEGARAWFRREDDAPGSWEWCAQVLGINPQAGRERVASWGASRSPLS